MLTELINMAGSTVNYSETLINLRDIMTMKNPIERPNIDDLLQNIAKIQSLCPIVNIPVKNAPKN